jgi:hypothetical protein
MQNAGNILMQQYHRLIGGTKTAKLGSNERTNAINWYASDLLLQETLNSK